MVDVPNAKVKNCIVNMFPYLLQLKYRHVDRIMSRLVTILY